VVQPQVLSHRRTGRQSFYAASRNGLASEAHAARCADTGPLNYLVLTSEIELLPKLFERVLAPQAVRDELADGDAPAAVRARIAQTPPWLTCRMQHGCFGVAAF